MPMNSTAAKTKKSATASLWINTKISTWWQRNKLSAASSKRTTAATTQKWRNLSPDEPPLPFLSSSLNHSTTKSNNVVARGITLKSSSGTRQDCSEQKMIAPTVLPEKLIFNNQQQQQQQEEFMLSTSIYLSHHHSMKGATRGLYTIPESSELNTTNSNTTVSSSTLSESTSSISIIINPFTPSSSPPQLVTTSHRHSQVVEEEEEKTTPPTEIIITPIKSSNNVSSSSIVELPPSLSSPSSTSGSLSSSSAEAPINPCQRTSSSGDNSSSSPVVIVQQQESLIISNNKIEFIPVCDWPSLVDDETSIIEPQFNTALQGNEEKCQLVFCQLLQSVVQYHNPPSRDQGYKPKEMHFLFSAGHFTGIKIILQDESRQDYLQFGGNLQYAPPELFMDPYTYNEELVNVWTLGIILHKMLVGQYPVSSSTGGNDWQLIQKMIASKWDIEAVVTNNNDLSMEVKDLLKRMLATERKRASLDLVLFHPWVNKSAGHDASGACISTKRYGNRAGSGSDNAAAGSRQRGGGVTATQDTTTTTTTTTTVEAEKKKTNKKKKKWAKMVKKVVRIIVKGPYPPPPLYAC